MIGFSNLPVLFMQYLNFEDVLFQLEGLGLFDFILPFLLMFAIVFGVLSYTGIFGEKGGLHAVIAIVLAMLAIRWPVYTTFLNVISPKLGVGLVIILVLVILTGMFVPKGSKATLGWILLGVGFVVFLVILGSSYGDLSGYGFAGGLTEDLIGYLVIVALIVGVIVAVVVGNKDSSSKNPVADALGGLWKN